VKRSIHAYYIQFNCRQCVRVAGTLLIVLFHILSQGLGGRAIAQTGSSTVAGVVRDQLGGALPGARVGLIRSGDQQKRLFETISTQDGAFKFVDLAAGEYVLEASFPGSQTVRKPLTLGGEQQVRQDITLQLLAIEERINVTNRSTEDTERQSGGRGPRGHRDCRNSTSSVEPPVAIARRAPQYPTQLRDAGSEGRVVLVARIAIDGSLTAVRVLSTERPEFGQAAIAAVKDWEFEPTCASAKPVETAITVTVDFQIQR
jgi:TonB family protein